jgi:hypothetical protein
METTRPIVRQVLGLAYVILPCALVAAAIIRFLARSNVEIPMIDDWLLIPWGTQQTDDASWKEYWTTVNGHQLILVKGYVKALAHFAALDLRVSAFIAVILVALSVVLFLATLPARHRASFLVFSAGFAILALNVRQLQNFFLVICFTWAMGLLAIALFVACHRDGSVSRIRWVVAMCVMFLASLTGGLGIVLPMYAAGAYMLDFPRQRTRSLVVVVLAIVSVFLATVYPRMIGAYEGPPAFGFDLLLSAPIKALAMFLVAVGQPFAAWKASGVPTAMAFGIAGVGFSLWGMAGAARQRRFVAFLFENPLIVCGLIFSALLVVTRGKLLGELVALEPRYTTAAMLVWLGLLMFGWRNLPDSRWVIAIAAVVLGVAAHVNGSASGFRYLDGQRRQSMVVTDCFRAEGWQFSPECIDLAYPGPIVPRKLFDATNRALYDEHKSFYARRSEAEETPIALAPGETRLTTRALSATAVRLTWTYEGEAANFRVMRRARTSGSWYVIAEIPGHLRTLVNEPLPKCNGFVYRVMALSELGVSPPSNESAVHTECAPPSSLTATVVGPNRIDLNWSLDEKPQGIRVMRRGATGGWYVVTEIGGPLSTFSNQPVPPCTQLTYRIYAISPSGISPPSNEVTVRSACPDGNADAK